MTAKKPPQTKPKKKPAAAKKKRAAASDSSKAKPSREKSSAKKPGKTKAAAPSGRKGAKPRAESSTPIADAVKAQKAKRKTSPKPKAPKPVPAHIAKAIERAEARSRGESPIYEFEQVAPFIDPKAPFEEESFLEAMARRAYDAEKAREKAEAAKRKKIRSDLVESKKAEDAAGDEGAKMGRPSVMTDDMKVDILVEIMLGRTVRDICEDDAFPARSTVYRELALDSDFSDQYARAHEVKADEIFDGMLKLIDETPEDKASIMKAREQLAARRYVLAKLMPDKYGPKSTVTVIGSNRIAPIDDHDGVEEAREKYENARDFEF